MEEQILSISHSRKISKRGWKLRLLILDSLIINAFYELNAVEINKNKNVGLTILIKNYTSVYENASHFDHCKITDVKLFLNNQSYPYGNLNLDIDEKQYALLNEMYITFQTNYYSRKPQPYLSKSDFLDFPPLILIDCSKQNESLKTGSVDIRLEFKAKENFPAQTAAYCLILHDRVLE